MSDLEEISSAEDKIRQLKERESVIEMYEQKFIYAGYVPGAKKYKFNQGITTLHIPERDLIVCIATGEIKIL